MRYKTLPTKGDVDPEMALLQGAYALDAAAEVAEKTNDVEGLLNAAAMWMKYSEAFDHYASNAMPTPDQILGDKKFQIGFGLAPEEEPIAANEEDELDD